MGELVKHNIHLRAWGASELLDVKGMIITNLETAQGAVVETKAYVVRSRRCRGTGVHKHQQTRKSPQETRDWERYKMNKLCKNYRRNKTEGTL